jgi:hypothetical protein
MRRISIAAAATLILGALTIAPPKLKSEIRANALAGMAAPQLGKKACTNVKFRFTNNRSDQATIRIEKVKYLAGGQFDHTEDVHTANDCKYGSTCTTTGDNLPDTDGRSVTRIQLYYRFLPKSEGANWSDLVHTPDEPDVASTTCGDGITYGDGSKGFMIPPK